MTENSNAAEAERAFFAALQTADVARLDRVLTKDFVLVDVMRGGVISREMLLDALRAGGIRFESIEVIDAAPRSYGATTIIVGQTKMHGHAGAQAWSVSSRYTHVYVEQAGYWRLASAQGTPIA